MAGTYYPADAAMQAHLNRHLDAQEREETLHELAEEAGLTVDEYLQALAEDAAEARWEAARDEVDW